MRRIQQDVRRLGLGVASAPVPVAEAAASIATASTKKAALTALTDGDLTELNSALATKLQLLDERLTALEPPE